MPLLQDLQTCVTQGGFSCLVPLAMLNLDVFLIFFNLFFPNAHILVLYSKRYVLSILYSRYGNLLMPPQTIRGFPHHQTLQLRGGQQPIGKGSFLALCFARPKFHWVGWDILQKKNIKKNYHQKTGCFHGVKFPINTTLGRSLRPWTTFRQLGVRRRSLGAVEGPGQDCPNKNVILYITVLFNISCWVHNSKPPYCFLRGGRFAINSRSQL